MEQEFVMASCLHSLDLIGLDPFKTSFKGNIKAFIFIAITLASYGLNMAGVVFKYDGIRSLADSIDAIPAGQQAMVKLLSVVILKKKMKHLYEMANQRWPDDIYDEELEIRLKSISKQFKKLYVMYRRTIWLTAVLYVSKPLILFSKILITEYYVPCDLAKDYCYVPVILAQNLYIVILSFVVYTFDGVFYAFLFCAYTELEKIKHGFKNLKVRLDVQGDDPEVYEEFCKIAQHHNFALRLLNDVNDVYYLQLLNHFTTIAATIVFGIFFMNMDGFPPSVEQLSRYIPYLITYHFQLYIYCISGQEIYNQVYSVGDSIYESNWYAKRQPKFTKGMLLVMKISGVGNKLSIGNLWKLNLSTFMSVIKTSVSFHALMQTMYKADDAVRDGN